MQKQELLPLFLGGVSANSLLRQSLALKHDSAGWDVFIPPMSLCTDNAAMVGISANFTTSL